MNIMLVGLCNLCDDYGYFNFDEFCDLIIDVLFECFDFNVLVFIKDVGNYQRFLKIIFFKFVQKYFLCFELCMVYVFDLCLEEYSVDVVEIFLVYEVYNFFLQFIEFLSCEDLQQSELKFRLDEKLKVNFDYLGYLLRIKY